MPKEYYTICNFNEEDIILRSGEVSSRLYYIAEGSAISYLNFGEDEEFLVGVMSTGRFFGQEGILIGEKSPTTIVANEALTLHVVEKEDLLKYLSANPQTGMNLMKNLARENAALSKHLSMISDELVNTIELMEKNKPVPIDLKKKLLEYKIGAYIQ